MGSCVNCGSPLKRRRRYDFKSAAFRAVYDDKFVYACTQCGLHQADVSKVDDARLLHYYRTEYRAIAKIGIGETGHRWYRARAIALAELAAEHCRGVPARAFEVGAGYGYNLNALKALYPDLLLFTDELDESIVLPDEIRRADLSNGGPYDIVILSHVLEHFADPKQVLTAALNALSKEGIVVIEVPNDVPGIVPLNGPDEPHLTFFTAQTLKALVGAELVYAAGPPYRRKSVARVRSFVAGILARTPMFSSMLANRRRRVVSSPSFSVRRPDGVFLRAVLRH
jgi:SAM-dependent methyltransferase